MAFLPVDVDWRRLAFIWLAAVFFSTLPARAQSFSPLIQNGGYLVADDQGGEVMALFPDRPLIPASTLKVATALFALRTLGEDFRFPLPVYLSGQGDLYLRGSGDPFLVSEEVAEIARKLKEHGVTAIRDLIIDDTLFEVPGPPPGGLDSPNPYDAPSSACLVNFNTVHLRKGADGSVVSAEPQTPTLPLMQQVSRGLPPGTHRVNLGSDPEIVRRHATELFVAIFRLHRITLSGTVRFAPVPPGLPPLFTHRSSKTLAEVVRMMLLFSTNTMANQLFLYCGGIASGFPATWEKGRAALTGFLRREIGLDDPSIRIRDGSGLSRDNRLTPRALVKILAAFTPYQRLLPLHQRLRVPVKSGTMEGVYGYAGYLPAGYQWRPFALLLNQAEDTRERVLEHLYRWSLKKPNSASPTD